ncbi:MAG: NPCBM/NEW2 domain-containing protein [Phycisphaerales bacterium]|nr:NPCBM/NEW2 domain-containing protein [Phycisphaerales bacterium]
MTRSAVRQLGIMTLAITAFCGAARGERVMVTALDGAERTGELTGLTNREVTVQTGETADTLALDDVAEITFADQVTRRTHFGACTFLLADGGKLSGTLEDGGPGQLAARTALGGGLALPYEHLAGIRMSGPDEAAALFDEALANRLAGKDVLIALGDNGPNALRGTLNTLNPEEGEFTFAGKTRRFRTSKVYGVVFAGGVANSATGMVTITLTNGESFTGNNPALRKNTLTFTASFGADLEIPLENVRRLQLRSPRVVYLGDREPKAETSEGMLYTDWLVRKNRNVFNQPIVLGGRTYEHGLGVHARATLTYALAGAYETFAATVGIDDAVRPGGHVNFVIIGDGKRLYETGPLTGSDPPRPVRVDVSGVGELRLAVDIAADGDVGDWADWADARVILPQVNP